MKAPTLEPYGKAELAKLGIDPDVDAKALAIALEFQEDPSLHRNVQYVLSRGIDLERVFASDVFMSRMLSCDGRCGKLLQPSEMRQVDAPGCMFRNFCEACAAQKEENKQRLLCSRNTKSAMKRGHGPPAMSDREWADAVAYFDDSCAYCGKDWYVVEHATPTKRGGRTAADNCLPACYSCNTLKGGKSLEEWIAEGYLPFKDERQRALEWLRSKGRP